MTAGEYERQLGLDLANYLADATRDRDVLPVLLSPTSQDPDPRLTAFCREKDIALLRGATRSTPRTRRTRAPDDSGASWSSGRQRASPPSPRPSSSPRTSPWQILGECGIQTPRQERVTTPAEAASAAASFDGPVVIKAVADGLLHKSDLGLVVTNVVGADAVQLRRP